MCQLGDWVVVNIKSNLESFSQNVLRKFVCDLRILTVPNVSAAIFFKSAPQQKPALFEG
jgi:hypothetical protein